MKKGAAIFLILFSAFISRAQNASDAESYGQTLNVGIGIGYYGYIGHTIPAIHLDYEFDVARNFTLAPFATFYTYRSNYYWGNPSNPYRYYYYRETVIPIGVKGTYYFDRFLNAGDNWDFYLAGSLGFTLRSVKWERGYDGDRTLIREASPLYADAHIGAEYHVNERIGLFLDLSTGLSTFGIAFHR